MFGEYSAGAENDLVQATRIARKMVAHWGMSERVGPVACATSNEHPFLGRDVYEQREFSERTAQVIDAATASLQQGIDRKQAHGVLDQVMPVVGGGLKALAQAAVTRMMPALPAAPTVALPAPAADVPQPSPEAPAKPKRKRAPKATPSQAGGAK